MLLSKKALKKKKGIAPPRIEFPSKIGLTKGVRLLQIYAFLQSCKGQKSRHLSDSQ
jgi:hypothetical protein